MIQHQTALLCLGIASLLAACTHRPPPCCATYVRPALVGTNTTTAEPQRSTEYQSRHQRRVRKSRTLGFPFVFVGDSLTDMWTADPPRGGRAVWNRVFAPRGGGLVGGFQQDDGAALYGFGGDTTGNLLWRIDGGELDGLSAADQPRPTRVIVLNIGTNNLRAREDSIAAGVEAVVQTLRCRVPTARILLVGLLPRQSGAWLAKVARVNQLIARLDDGGASVRFVDVGSHFLDQTGQLRSELYRDDAIHLAPAGYEVWAAALAPAVDALLVSQRSCLVACGR